MNIREHVLFDDCERKVKELCYNRFQEECTELDDATDHDQCPLSELLPAAPLLSCVIIASHADFGNGLRYIWYVEP